MRPHEFIDMVAKAGLARRTTVWHSWFLAGMAVQNGIEGDLVEAGVFAGTNAAAMWRGAVDHGDARHLHLYDSFQGIPPAGPEDDEAWQSKAPYGSACSIESVRANMEKWGVDEDWLFYWPGWFEDTLQHHSRKIAVLRLDADLYESTRLCVEHLYPHVEPGGVVIVDDFALKGCRKAVEPILPNRWHKIPDGGGPVWWRKE